MKKSLFLCIIFFNFLTCYFTLAETLREFTLPWSPKEDAQSYEIEISKEETLSKAQLRKTTVPELKGNLAPGIYYFRLRYQNKKGILSPWSDVTSFWIHPDPPHPIEPKNNQALQSNWRKSGIKFRFEKNPIKDSVLLEVTDHHKKVTLLKSKDSEISWQPENYGEHTYKVSYSDDLVYSPLEWSEPQKFTVLPPNLHRTFFLRLTQLFSSIDINNSFIQSTSKGSLTSFGLGAELNYSFNKSKKGIWTQLDFLMLRQKGGGQSYFLPHTALRVFYSWINPHSFVHMGPYLELGYRSQTVFFNLVDPYIGMAYGVSAQRIARASPGLGFHISQTLQPGWMWFISALVRIDMLGTIYDPAYGKQVLKGSLGYDAKAGAYFKGFSKFLWNLNLKFAYTEAKWDLGRTENLTLGLELGAGFNL